MADSKRGVGSVLLGAIGTIILTLVTTVATTSLQSEADIEYADAAQFLQEYYGSVTQKKERRSLWEDKQTETFRSFPDNDFDSFNDFYESLSRVEVLRVYPIASESNRYFVALKFVSKGGGSSTETFKFYLACNDWVARLPVLTCRDGHEQIDVVQQTDGE